MRAVLGATLSPAPHQILGLLGSPFLVLPSRAASGLLRGDWGWGTESYQEGSTPNNRKDAHN